MAGEYSSAILLLKLAAELAQFFTNSSNQKIIQTHNRKGKLNPS